MIVELQKNKRKREEQGKQVWQKMLRFNRSLLGVDTQQHYKYSLGNKYMAYFHDTVIND